MWKSRVEVGITRAWEPELPDRMKFTKDAFWQELGHREVAVYAGDGEITWIREGVWVWDGE